MSEDTKQQKHEAMQYDTVLATGRGNIIANEQDENDNLKL